MPESATNERSLGLQRVCAFTSKTRRLQKFAPVQDNTLSIERLTEKIFATVAVELLIQVQIRAKVLFFGVLRGFHGYFVCELNNCFVNPSSIKS